jgi:hypothetical protein
MNRKDRTLSSRELLERIGLGEDTAQDLLQGEPLDGLLEDLHGDLGAVLSDRYDSLTKRHALKPGDRVTWKPGLKNRRVPLPGQPAVVVAVLDEPVFDSEQDSGSTYFRDPLDLVLGVIWDKEPHRGDFVLFHFDSRRFQPWEG